MIFFFSSLVFNNKNDGFDKLQLSLDPYASNFDTFEIRKLEEIKYSTFVFCFDNIECCSISLYQVMKILSFLKEERIAW